jgi:L-ascorbate metabolism protein UlaG (beta-lactamase superfamily)
VTLGGLRVRATSAVHDGSRPPFVRAGAVGYAILGSSSIYFAGDTDLFDELEGLVPDLDVALVPVWGWGPTLGRGGHLDPARAAEAVRRLRPRLAVPIHWGTYAPVHLGLRRPPAFLREPVDEFVRAAAELAPSVEIRVLAPGERTDIPSRDQGARFPP